MSKMKKEYDRLYIFAGSRSTHGSMACRVCGGRINGMKEDYLVSRENVPFDDWGYVCRHRKCLPEKYAIQFNLTQKNENERRDQHNKKVNEIKSYIETYATKDGIDPALYEVLEYLGIFKE